jgi:hypothetical protein
MILDSKVAEHAAGLALRAIDSPLAVDFLGPDDRIEWDRIAARYHVLSGGEQAWVDLACHLTGRACFRAGSYSFPPLSETIGNLDPDLRPMAAGLIGLVFGSWEWPV